MLKTLMEGMQSQQMKELETLFERDNKEMKSNQAKASVETLRDVQNDKNLKTKAEKERIIREKNANNTKRFIDERKSQAMKQANRREKLRKDHGNQALYTVTYILQVFTETTLTLTDHQNLSSFVV